MNLREEARQYFNETLGFTYQDLHKTDILMLRGFLEKSLQAYEAIDFRLNPTVHQRYYKDRTLKSAHFFMDSEYFTGNEAISLNENGFIGFCGWASDEHLAPVLEAFTDWCNYLKHMH